MRYGLMSRRLLPLFLSCLLLLGVILGQPLPSQAMAAPDAVASTFIKIDPGVLLTLSTPSNLSAEIATDYRVILRWRDNASSETGFGIERRLAAGGDWANVGSVAAVAGTGSIGAFEDTTHVPGKTYEYRVYAQFSTAYTPVYSNVVTAATTSGVVPAAPANLQISSATSDQVVLSWDAPAVANVTEYVLQYGDFSGDYTTRTIKPSGSSYTLSGLAEQYHFRVRLQARNWYTGISPFSAEKSANTLPNAPGNLACSAQSDGVTVTWADNSKVENWYVVHRKDAATPWQEVGSVGKDVTSYKDAAAVAGTAYTYRVAAVSMLGYTSPWSGEFTITAGAAPATPAPSASATPSPSASASTSPSPSASPGSLPLTAAAIPNAATVLVNGEPVSFEAYNIGGYNYFKLRDLAMAITGTGKQFGVSWSAALKVIDLLPGQAYTPVGGEFSLSGLTATVTASRTGSAITLNGVPVTLGAYNIRNNNYFKLRDIGQTINFGVDYDAVNRIIKIDTTKGYTAP